MVRTFCVGQPAIGQDVAELIGELQPGVLTDVNYDPCRGVALGMQPNRRGSGGVFVNPQPPGLAV
jgi:hypothetical protein